MIITRTRPTRADRQVSFSSIHLQALACGRLSRKLVFVAAMASACFTGISPAATEPSSIYAGKTLNIIVGVQVGGTSDHLVRGLAVYLQKHIPGNPSVIVQNMTGAAGNIAFNYLAERAAPDGLTIVYNPYQAIAQAMKDPSLRVRFENFEYLGGISDTKVLYMRTDAVPGGAKRPSDIKKADGIIVGAYSTSDLGGMTSRLALNVLGVRYKLVTGYRGGADIFLALQRGEVQFHNTSIGTYRTRSASFIKSGEGIGVAYLVTVDPNGEFEKDKYITEVPPFPDLYKDIYGKLPSGSSWNALNWLSTQTNELTYVAFAPHGTPAEYLTALRTGFEAAFTDPDYVKATLATNGIPYNFVNVERGQSIIRSLVEVSPEVLHTLRETMADHP